MIRILTILVLILWSGLQLHAQRRFQVQVIAGTNASQIDGDLYAGYNKLGLVAGLGVNTILTEKTSLGIEILYSQQGSQSELFIGNNFQPFKIQLDYIEVPILYHFKDWLVEGEEKADDYYKIMISGGVTYGRLFNTSIESASPDFRNLVDFFRDDQVALTLGATFMATKNIGFTARWTRSFIFLYRNEVDNPNSNSLLVKFLTFRTFYQF